MKTIGLDKWWGCSGNEFAAIRAVVRTAVYYGMKVIGIRKRIQWSYMGICGKWILLQLGT